MTRRSRLPPSRFLVFFTSVLFLQFLGGLAGEPSTANNEIKSKGHGASGGGVGVKVLLICSAVVAIVAFCVFLFKRWQKKKREEQHARLLRLFEEDDELELELGLRD
ncbi:hypothetical protein EJ110_NYTH20238 [Nymphaea thermarum]|nr:hypothetical protein EJ110_NYTH20238 [Nymphaea thermarum]